MEGIDCICSYLSSAVFHFQLKMLRGVVIAGGAEYDDFFPFLRVLEPCFMNCIKDLRSQVVREGCITVA